jgi:hypothetical protein
MYFDEVCLPSSHNVTLFDRVRMVGRLPIKGSRILNPKARRLSLASAMNGLIINSSTRAANILETSSVAASAGLLTFIRTVKSPATEFTRLPGR